MNVGCGLLAPLMLYDVVYETDAPLNTQSGAVEASERWWFDIPCYEW